MPSKHILKVGTRGSDLALVQTRIVLDALRRKNKTLFFEQIVIKTSGDDLSRKKKALSGKDSFTREIDQALLSGEIDFAVHSLKDVPLDSSKEITIAAYPKRESPLDVLVSRRKGSTLETLKFGARIGTSSIRRAIQLKIFRPDYEIVEIHGNVPTRIRKMRLEGDLDALVLAQAGLNRLDMDKEIDQVIPDKVVLPAIGQGCLAITARTKDKRTNNILKTIDHEKTRICVSAERAFSKELGGGCNTPIAGLATIKNNEIRLKGLVVGEIGSKFKSNFLIREEMKGKKPEVLGRALARKLRENS